MHASSVSVTMNNTSAIARPSSYRKSYEAEMSIEKKSVSISNEAVQDKESKKRTNDAFEFLTNQLHRKSS